MIILITIMISLSMIFQTTTHSHRGIFQVFILQSLLGQMVLPNYIFVEQITILFIISNILFHLDFVFQDILKDPDDFRNFLEKNLSFPVNMTQALLNATVNGSKVTQFCWLHYYSHFQSIVFSHLCFTNNRARNNGRSTDTVRSEMAID